MAVQKAKSPSSLFTGLLVLVRALFIFFGGTVAAHWLGSRITEETVEGIGNDPAPTEPYFQWLGEAIIPNSLVTDALGNSMLLGSAAIFIGLVLGGAFAGLLRIPGLGVGLGTLALPSLALFVPGIVLFPLARLALDRGLIPIGGLAEGQPLDQSLRFLGFWGLLVGLAIAPAVAAVMAGSGRSKLSGLATIEAPLASRTTPRPRWRFGLPLSSFGLAMASAEILSGQQGVIGRFYRSLQLGNVAGALDLAVMVILAAAIVAVVIDLVGLRAGGGDTPSGAEVAPMSPVAQPTGTSRLLLPLVALLLMAGGAAAVGLVIDTTARSEPLDLLTAPTFGGPWLGTDEAGRSMLALTVAALGPALSAALVPGLVAVAIGLIVAAIRRASPRPVERITGVTIDLLWWPLPILVPLVALFSLTQVGQAEFQIGVLGLTGAMIAPLASRLIGQSVLPAATARIQRLVASWLYCSTIAFAAYLLAGYVGLYNNEQIEGLGVLIRNGVDSYDEANWPLLIPSLAAIALVGLFQGLAAAVAVPDLALDAAGDRATHPGTDGGAGTGLPRTGILQGVEPSPDTDADTAAEPEDVAGPDPQPQPILEPAVGPEPVPHPIPEPEPATATAAEPAAGQSPPMPDRSFLLTSSAKLHPVPTADDQPTDDQPTDDGTIDLTGSQTVELRPSAVRVVRTDGSEDERVTTPQSDPASDEPATDSQQKPVLASRRPSGRFGPENSDRADRTDA